MVCGPQKRGPQKRVKPNHGTRKKPAGFMPEPAGFMREPAGFVALSEAHASEAHVPFFHLPAVGVTKPTSQCKLRPTLKEWSVGLRNV